MILPEGIESMSNACNTAFSIMFCYNVISKSNFFSLWFIYHLICSWIRNSLVFILKQARWYEYYYRKYKLNVKITFGDNIMSEALQVICYCKLLWYHQRENAVSTPCCGKLLLLNFTFLAQSVLQYLCSIIIMKLFVLLIVLFINIA